MNQLRKSFFEQEMAIAEIEIPKQKYLQLQKRLSKNEKLSAKIEIKDNSQILYLYDDVENVIDLSELQQPKKFNVLYKDDKPLSFIHYYCKSKVGEKQIEQLEISEEVDLKNQDSNDIEINDAKSDSIRSVQPLKLAHLEINQPDLDINIPENSNEYTNDSLRKHIRDFAARRNYDSFTLKMIKDELEIYDEKQIKQLRAVLDDITNKEKRNGKQHFILKKSFQI